MARRHATDRRAARVEHRRSARGWMAPALHRCAAVLIVLGVVLLPAGVLVTHSTAQLTESEAFVETFAPLAHDPQVQAEVTHLVVTAIDVPELSDQVLSSLESLGVARSGSIDLPDWVTDSLPALEKLGLPSSLTDPLVEAEGPVDLEQFTATSVERIVEQGVDAVVSSSEFDALWNEVLQISHSQLLAQLTAGNVSNGLTIQLRPIISAARDQLNASGMGFAAFIPEITHSVVLIDSETMAQFSTGISVIFKAGPWLVWAPVAAVVVGVLASRNRRRALVLAGAAIALVMGVIGALITTGLAAGFVNLAEPNNPIGVAALDAYSQAVLPPAASTFFLISIASAVVVVVTFLAGRAAAFRQTPRVAGR